MDQRILSQYTNLKTTKALVRGKTKFKCIDRLWAPGRWSLFLLLNRDTNSRYYLSSKHQKTEKCKEGRQTRKPGLSEQHGGEIPGDFCCLPCSLLCILGNTQEHGWKILEVTCSLHARDWLLQRVQLPAQTSDAPALLQSTSPGARSHPQQPLRCCFPWVPPVRHSPWATLLKFPASSTNASTTVTSAILWATAVPPLIVLMSVMGSLCGALCLNSDDDSRSLCCCCHIVFKFSLLITDPSVLAPKLCYR